MRFELIDQVLECQPDRLVAVKNVTNAEEYLADHFPGFAVLPGVMMLETLVQAGRLLVAGRGNNRQAPYQPTDLYQSQHHNRAQTGDVQTQGPFVLTEVRNVRYGQMVKPGQTLNVEVTLRNQNDDMYELAGIGTVEEQVAVQGRFRLTPLPKPI